MLNSPDEEFFNQIKGKEILVKFDSSEVRTMYVEGNAEAVYYAMDEEEAYIGVNKTACSEMLVFFGSNEVETITFYQKPKGRLEPMRIAKHEELKLEGFKWQIEKRPSDIDALFTPRIKVPLALPSDENSTKTETEK